jgi:hypothetical protein
MPYCRAVLQVEAGRGEGPDRPGPSAKPVKGLTRLQ